MTYPEIDILFFFSEEDGRVRQVTNGIISSIATRKPLPDGPIGVEEIAIFWKRNMTKLMQERNFSLPLGFVKDGYYILINDSFQFSINRRLFLNMAQLYTSLTDTEFFYRYKYLYKGELDFSTLEDIKSQSRANINILEGGLYSLVKAREEQVYTLGMDKNYITLQNDGILLNKFNSVKIPENIPISYGDTPGSIPEFAVPMYTVGEEGIAPGVVLTDQQFEPVDDHFDYLANSSNYFMTVGPTFPSPVSATLTGKFFVSCLAGLSSVYGSLQLRWLNQDGALFAGIGSEPLTGIAKVPEESMETGKVYTFQFNETGTMQPGDRIFLLGAMFTQSIVSEVMTVQFLEGSTFTVKFATRGSITYTKMKTGWQVFKELVGRITGDENNAASDLLQNENSIALDTGNLQRGIETNGLSTSLKDFCEAFNIYHMGCYGVKNGKVRFEKRGYAFDTTVEPIALGETDLPTVTPATDLMYNTLKIGHKDQTLSDANSKADFCGTHNYNFPLIGGEQKQLTMQAPYKAGPYEREGIRLNLSNKPTTADANDDQVFVADVVPNSSNSFTGSFSALSQDGLNFFIAPNDFFPSVGSSVGIFGSASNDGNYTVLAVVPTFFFGNFVYVQEVFAPETLTPGVTVTILDGGLYKYRRDEIPDSGVYSPETVYNVGLRISKLMERHGPWLHSWLYGFDLEKITFESGTVNTELVVGGLADKRDFAVNGLGEKMFLPKYLEFSPISPTNLNDIYEGDVNKSVSIILKNGIVNGFPIETGLAVTTRKPQKFKILCWPDTNIELLK